MKKVRWGVLSTAKIAREKIIPAMQNGKYTEIIAIASREIAKARVVADNLRIAKAYGSYEQLLSDPEIDAVYIPLPNHLHIPWSIKCIEAGKHVLCEKPIGLSAEEAQILLDTANQNQHLKVMEAFMYRFHPQWKRVYDMVKNRAIGELKTIHSFFSYYNIDPDNVRNKAEIGGGGLMDIGCYCISFARFLFESEPKKVTGIIEWDAQFKTDCLTSGMMEFSQGTATFTSSTQLIPHQRAQIFGTEGLIEIEIPVNTMPDNPAKIWYSHNDKREEIIIDANDQYTMQGDSFSQAILNNSGVPTPLDDAVNNMKVIDAVRESANSGKSIIMQN
jgi:predicted dehydrogenase